MVSWGKERWKLILAQIRYNLEYNCSHVVVAGPQLVLRPDHDLQRGVDQVVHSVHVLLQRPCGVDSLPVVHEVHPAVEEGFQVLKSRFIRFPPPADLTRTMIESKFFRSHLLVFFEKWPIIFASRALTFEPISEVTNWSRKNQMSLASLDIPCFKLSLSLLLGFEIENLAVVFAYLGKKWIMLRW